MLFNSIEFLVFLPIVFFLYWFLFKKNVFRQNLLLLLASYVFYGWWSWKFMLLLMASTMLDFGYGFGVASADKRTSKIFLWLSILNNLGILGFFKYYNFFVAPFHGRLLQLALPVGISFYTFHGMSYVFDIYRGVRKPVRSFIDYALFVCFFPLLVAGPIERANHLLPQVGIKRSFRYLQAVEGCRLILWGMFKKVVVADSLAPVVERSFRNYSHNDAFTLLIGAFSFSIQIYGDFSGYSDIAIGTAKLFGFEVLSNFRFPYFSRDIAEFWRRWHLSLTSWFRDYLYIPLGGSREGKGIAIRNIVIVFLVSGLWHGASWNFIAWGGLHACAFLTLMLLGGNRKHTGEIVAYDRRFPSGKELMQMLTTFIFVSLAWVFFRIKDIGDAAGILERILANSVRHPGQYLQVTQHLNTNMAVFWMVPLFLLDWNFRKDERNPLKPLKGRVFYYIILGMLIVFAFNKKTNFIYFQF